MFSWQHILLQLSNKHHTAYDMWYYHQLCSKQVVSWLVIPTCNTIGFSIYDLPFVKHFVFHILCYSRIITIIIMSRVIIWMCEISCQSIIIDSVDIVTQSWNVIQCGKFRQMLVWPFVDQITKCFHDIMVTVLHRNLCANFSAH